MTVCGKRLWLTTAREVLIGLRYQRPCRLPAHQVGAHRHGPYAEGIRQGEELSVNRISLQREGEDHDQINDRYNKGKVLLYPVNLVSPDEISYVYEGFGWKDVTFIGYPTMDGSSGHRLDGAGVEAAIRHHKCFCFCGSPNRVPLAVLFGLSRLPIHLVGILHGFCQQMRDSAGRT